jgi:hypothetical protein
MDVEDLGGEERKREEEEEEEEEKRDGALAPKHSAVNQLPCQTTRDN